MNKPEIYNYVSTDNIELNMNLYRATSNRKNITIIYFHGGGLLYGVRDDLPDIYLNMFLEAGYDYLALDYPLAPESSIDEIINSSLEEILYYLEHRKDVFKLENEKYLLFGRSAGAYLSFMMCNQLIKNEIQLPMAIISLYGYTRLDEVQFNTPSNYYNKLSKISNENVDKIINDTPITYGPINTRISLYIKARQEGTWIQNICGSNDKDEYSIPEDVLQSFPPTFLSAATLDPDVPYKLSKRLSKLIPNSNLLTVYEDVHDFDRDVSKNIGKTIYEDIIKWLENGIRKDW